MAAYDLIETLLLERAVVAHRAVRHAPELGGYGPAEPLLPVASAYDAYRAIQEPTVHTTPLPLRVVETEQRYRNR